MTGRNGLNVLLANCITLIWTLFACANDCPDKLVWKQLYYVDDTSSIDIQICCNISKVWAAQVESNWRPVLPAALDDVSISHLVSPGFDMLLSRCSNGTYLGVVPRKDCVAETGKVLNLEANHHMPFDQWYLMCFETMQEELCPRICSLEKLCTNEVRCRNVWIQREVVNVSQESVTIVMDVGQLPFGAMLETEVREMIHSNGTSVARFKNIEPLRSNSKLIYQVHGLKANSWYHLITCTRIPTPEEFRTPGVATHLPNESVVCLDKEIVRTWGPPHRSDKNCGSCAFFSLLLRAVTLLPFLTPYVRYS